ncbi:MAG: DUF2332 domain-containing protein [Oscillochloris sp.]|nr:DUF2332 domain-containing protein [Oscillochloris sp.]
MADVQFIDAALADVARRFTEFAVHCEGVAPLYAMLAPYIADDPELLALAAQTQPGQPPPNMLFAAVHDLLLRAPEQRLAAYYPTVGGSRAPDTALLALFRVFCLDRAAEILPLLRTRLTQTNEVLRSTYLLPGLATVQQLAGGRPLALIELGPSAGLNLNLDRYGYRYSNGMRCGDPEAPVQLVTELRGPVVPPIPAAPPDIIWRIGVDLNPVDLADPAARRWLEALIWPEHVERRERLRAAMEMARIFPPPLVRGDLLEWLPQLIAQAPPDAVLCIVHTHVLYQLSPELRTQVHALLAVAAQHRPIYRLSSEHDGALLPDLKLICYRNDSQQIRVLAHTTGHAHWIEWLG